MISGISKNLNFEKVVTHFWTISSIDSVER
mgnify:CR=1 FL=1